MSAGMFATSTFSKLVLNLKMKNYYRCYRIIHTMIGVMSLTLLLTQNSPSLDVVTGFAMPEDGIASLEGYYCIPWRILQLAPASVLKTKLFFV